MAQFNTCLFVYLGKIRFAVFLLSHGL